jgi:hypothetical protein
MKNRLAPTVIAFGLVSLFTNIASEMMVPVLPVFLMVTLGTSATSRIPLLGVDSCRLYPSNAAPLGRLCAASFGQSVAGLRGAPYTPSTRSTDTLTFIVRVPAPTKLPFTGAASS